MILTVILYAILDLLFMAFAMLFVNWWAPLFVVQREISDRGVVTIGPRLPEWLAWFDTFDASLDAGLPAGKQGSFWTRVTWLYRNPVYGFTYWPLGRPFDPDAWTVTEFTELDDKGNVNFRAVGPNGLFNWNVVKWGIHWKVGWKAWNHLRIASDGQRLFAHEPWGPEMRIPFTFSITMPKR